MRAACVIVLACVTVIRGQMMAGESDPSLHELFQTLLARDHGNADEFLLPSAGPEKRQHPGRREDADYEEEALLQKRQHPGRREAEEAARVTRQHPGKRWYPDAPSELTKRQHPGKRYLMLLHKRQHPGRREDYSDLEKRQHPGKRFWEEPCEDCDPAGILLELLDDGTKSRSEEKRQHPGKRLDVEDDETELE